MGIWGGGIVLVSVFSFFECKISYIFFPVFLHLGQSGGWGCSWLRLQKKLVSLAVWIHCANGTSTTWTHLFSWLYKNTVFGGWNLPKNVPARLAWNLFRDDPGKTPWVSAIKNGLRSIHKGHKPHDQELKSRSRKTRSPKMNSWTARIFLAPKADLWNFFVHPTFDFKKSSNTLTH